MYVVIVEEANTRGSEGPIEMTDVDTLSDALSTTKVFADQYLSNPDDPYTIKIIPTSIF